MPDERFPNDELDNRLSDIDRRMGDIDQRTGDTSFGDRTIRGRDIPANDRVIRNPEPLIETNETRERERQTAADARAAYGRETQVDRTTYDREHLHPAHEHDRGKVWPWVLGLAILGLIALPMLNHRNDDQANRPAQTQVGSKQVGPAVNFQGKSYVGAGEAKTLNASDMVAVGKTTGGSTVYRARGGGGGMGADTYYIRHANGTFQALAPYNP